MTTVRPARREDVPQVLALIRELAVYEREPDAVRTTEEDLATALFPVGADPLVHCLVAESAGDVVGMAIWFRNFSTWEGRHGIFLEDLYVRPTHRREGLGRALLAALAAEAVRLGCPRLDWQVLRWNTPADAFYRSLGAAPMQEWMPYRIEGAALEQLAVTRAAAH